MYKMYRLLSILIYLKMQNMEGLHMYRIYRRIEKHAVVLKPDARTCSCHGAHIRNLPEGGSSGRDPASGTSRREVLRFHVLANSDSDEDQALKLKVRDAVLAFLEEQVPEAEDAEESTRWVRARIDQIEELSREVVAENGKDYPVSAAVTTCWFPDRTYGDLTFPAGNYEALRIEIGDGAGHNWWWRTLSRVVFP